MPLRSSPTIRHRRLAAELERLRESVRLSREEVAERLDWHTTKVWRIETARSWITPGDLRDLLDLYDVHGPRRDALIALARHSRQKGWWTTYKDVLRGSYVDLEAEASMIRNYEPLLIPGLLQTEAYARTVIRAALVLEPEEVRRRTEARLARQELLVRDVGPGQLWVVIDEAAIRRLVGGRRVMSEQLQSLMDVSERPNVTIQVIPETVGAHPGLSGPFVMLDFPNPEFFAPVVFLESDMDGLYLEEAEQLTRYTLMFDHLRARALGPEESVALIQATMDGLEHA